MVSIPVQCPYCHSTAVIKAGKSRRRDVGDGLRTAIVIQRRFTKSGL